LHGIVGRFSEHDVWIWDELGLEQKLGLLVGWRFSISYNGFCHCATIEKKTGLLGLWLFAFGKSRLLSILPVIVRFAQKLFWMAISAGKSVL